MPAKVRIRGPSTGGRNLRGYNKKIRKLTASAAVETADRAARVITSMARQSFDSGQNCYNSPRRLGVDGNKLSLTKTGATRRALGFTSDGTRKIRAVLPERYMVFLIGKYKILPIGNAAIPKHWQEAINKLLAAYMDVETPKALDAA